ncbi:MAG TPA: AgmX/PglI C-terminal domain-containing protein [Steroidobacter sp.]|uniref:AgmX/PglI C-terminal domain-containing protein n=1 Tax=Steroidobacter sp. TaxID=1978227 RepID=UPI002EDA35F4
MAAKSAAVRTKDDVRRVIDIHKGGIFALYNRALRDQPYLKGKIVLSMTIAPEGNVTKRALVSSTLHHAELEKGVVERICSIDFGAKGSKVYFDPAYEMSFISTAGLRKE